MPKTVKPQRPVEFWSVEHHAQILDEVKSLFALKNATYNGGAELESYFPFGLKSYSQMLHVKSQRIVSIAAQDVPPNFESVRDSAKDLINYAVFLIMWSDANEPIRG